MADILQYAVRGLNSGEIGICLYHLEILWWDSIRIVFWPLMGILGMIYVVYVERKRQVMYWSLAGSITLGIGWILAFCLSYHEFKRELTRFMMPGYFLGMILIAFLIGRMFTKDKIARCVSVASMFIILCGQIPYRLIDMVEILQTDRIVPLIRQMIVYIH